MEAINYCNIPIASEEVVDHLKTTLQIRSVCQQVLSKQIIIQASQSRKIEVTSEEIQEEANKIRLSKRLEKASDTIAWLQEQMISADEWEASIRHQLLSQKLACNLFNQEAEAYFAQHRLEFEEFIVYQILISNRALSEELYYQIIEDEISFYHAAHIYNDDLESRQTCGYLGKVNRFSFDPKIAAVIFQDPVPINQLIGPIQTEQGFHLLRIEKHTPAELNDNIRSTIIDRLFQNWLNQELIYMQSNFD